MRSIRSTLIGLAAVAIVAGACSARTPANAPNPSAAVAPTAAVDGSPALPPASPDAWLAVGRTGAAGLEVILASTREKMLDLPTGIPAGDGWSRIFTATPAGGRTTVRNVVVQPGLGGPEVVIDGAWRLPTVGRTRCRWASPRMARRSCWSRTPRTAPSGPRPLRGAQRRSLAGPARIMSSRAVRLRRPLAEWRTLYVVEHLGPTRQPLPGPDRRAASGRSRRGLVDKPTSTRRWPAGRSARCAVPTGWCSRCTEGPSIRSSMP